MSKFSYYEDEREERVYLRFVRISWIVIVLVLLVVYLIKG
jgi:hypothetical protein